VTLADTVALSIEPTYRAVSPALSASSSWVNSCARRSRCRLIAITLFKSMAKMATRQERSFQERSFRFVLKLDCPRYMLGATESLDRLEMLP
jgi:hypothetical protein